MIPGLPPHVAAASGLVCAGDWLYVIPDDATQLIGFSKTVRSEAGRAYRLFLDIELPLEELERKGQKPDLESLALVPWRGGQALLAIGSGSTPRRRRGVLQSLGAEGAVDGEPIVFELGPLYEALPYKSLNLEGLAAVGDALFLGQRGNSSEGCNALIELNLSEALGAIEAGRAWDAKLIRGSRPLELGDLEGVPLTLTDLTPLDESHLLISAAAEATENPYDDGVVAGSALGRYRLSDGRLDMIVLNGSWKVEGVEVLDDGRILMVTDADDPHQSAVLIEATEVNFEADL